MSINYENWKDLTQAVQIAKPLDLFVTKNFFSKSFVSQTGTVLVEEETTGSGGVARFALGEAQGHILKKLGKTNKAYTIPQTKEKMLFSVKEFNDMKAPLGRQIIDGSNDRQSLFNEFVLKHTTDLKTRWERRFEMMAVAAISEGLIEVTEDSITYTIDYGFVATDNAITLSGADLWSTTTADPIKQIRTWIQSTQKRAGGQEVKAILMGDSAAEYFLGQTNVKSALNNLNYQVGQLKPLENIPTGYGATLLWRMPNGIPVYQYSQKYINASGAETDMLDPKKVVVLAAGDDLEKVKSTIYKFKKGDTLDIDTGSVEMLAEIIKNDDNTVGQFQLTCGALPLVKSIRGITVAKVLS